MWHVYSGRRDGGLDGDGVDGGWERRGCSDGRGYYYCVWGYYLLLRAAADVVSVAGCCCCCCCCRLPMLWLWLAAAAAELG